MEFGSRHKRSGSSRSSSLESEIKICGLVVKGLLSDSVVMQSIPRRFEKRNEFLHIHLKFQKENSFQFDSYFSLLSLHYPIALWLTVLVNKFQTRWNVVKLRMNSMALKQHQHCIFPLSVTSIWRSPELLMWERYEGHFIQQSETLLGNKFPKNIPIWNYFCSNERKSGYTKSLYGCEN